MIFSHVQPNRYPTQICPKLLFLALLLGPKATVVLSGCRFWSPFVWQQANGNYARAYFKIVRPGNEAGFLRDSLLFTPSFSYSLKKTPESLLRHSP